MIRSILAVVAGLVALTVVSFAIEAAVDPLLMRLFPKALPDATALAGSLPARILMVAYTMFSIAVGGYVTAWIARRSRITHAMVMSAIEVAFTIWVMVAMPFPTEVHPMPLWVGILGIILIVPAGWIGAVVRVRRRPAAT